MLRPKVRWPEIAAAACGAAGFVAFYLLGDIVATAVAFIAGILILAWSYLDVTR